MTRELQTPLGYTKLLRELKERIRIAQVRAALAVNRELVLLYWSIGRDILARQQQAGWGAQIIDRLARDLGSEFPGVEGFGPPWGFRRGLARPRICGNRLLHNCLGATRLVFLTGSRIGLHGCGSCRQRSSTAGAKTF